MSPGAYVLFLCAGLFFGLGLAGPRQLAGAAFALTDFRPPPDFRGQRLLLLIGFARVVMLVLVPMISMRLFIEEKRSRAIVVLFTSPLSDWQIVLGKWLGAMILWLGLVGLSVAALAVATPWVNFQVRTAVLAEFAVVLEGAGALAIGESVSSFANREGTAAALSLAVCWALLRICNTGFLRDQDLLACLALLVSGWLLTWRSVHAMRGLYCG